MAEQNASLQANLSQALGQSADPFTQAGMQANQQMQQSQQQVMDSPFPPMQMGSQAQPASPQATLSQVQQPLEEMKFPELAKQLGINTDGMSPSKELGGLQLMKRMQGALGPDFAQHPGFGPLMKAYQAHAGPDANESAMRRAGAKAQRTLGALMGGQQ